jgi:AraC-like DNA-binding protein
MTERDRILHERVVAIITRRLADPTFSVEELASEVEMSRSRLHRRLVREAGTPPGRMIRHARLLGAAELLQSTDWPIADVAAAVGYADPAHFTRSFKRRFGLTPTEYRSAG